LTQITDVRPKPGNVGFRKAITLPSQVTKMKLLEFNCRLKAES